MGVPHHPINKPLPEYLYWRDAVKDQMLARGYFSDNWHFPDAEFQQIVEGMRRLKPACDELATASAANNMASMQEIDEAVLQLVKDCGKKLENTTRTNNHVPPPGPGIAPAQVIVRPMLLPLNAPPQCQWSIATAAVPNAGPVGQNAPLANAPGPAQNVPTAPANPQAQNIAALPNASPFGQNAPLANAPGPVQNVPAPPAGTQAVLAPPAGTQAVLAPPAGTQAVLAPPVNPQAQNIAAPQARPILKLRTILYPQARLIPNVGLVSVWAISTGRNMRTNQRIFLGRSNRVPQLAFWVRHWVSNMLQRIPQVRSICPAQKIYLCRSNRVPQWAFWVRHWVLNMLQRIPQVRSICPAKKIYLCKSKRIPQWAFWVRDWVSNMLQRIPQVRSNCLAKNIYLCKSKWIPQWAFWVRD